MATPRQEIAKYVSQAQLSNVFTDYMGIINAKIYGAEGDGVTSDSSNLQLAVNAANDSSAYAIFLPQGTYACTGLSSDSNILWWGDNASFTGGYTGLVKQLGQWAIQPSGTTQGDILYYSSNNVWARLAKGTTDQILSMSSNAAPSWKAVPNAALSTDVVLSTAGTTHGNLLYYSSDNAWVKLTKGTTDQLLGMSSNSAPAWGSVPNAALSSDVALSTSATTGGDILYYSSDAKWVKLLKGTTDQVLVQSSNAAPSWGNVPNAALSANVVVSTAGSTSGDILYYSSDAKWVKLAKGTTDQVLTQTSNAAPAWGNVPLAAVPSPVVYSTAGTTHGDILYYSSDAAWVKLTKGTTDQILTMSSNSAPAWGTAPEAAVITKINLGTNMGVEVWQRGAGPFTANNAYTADRHQIILAGSDTIQVDREGTTKKTNSLYSSKAAFTLGTGAGASRHKQRLTISDNYHFLLGKAISLRKPVHANAASAVRAFITTDGTGGTTNFSSYHAGDSAWADLDVVNITVPSDATYVDFGLAFAATVTVYEDNAMLVIGSKAADYVALHPAEETQRCQRYYEVHGGGATNPIINTYAGGVMNAGITVSFNTAKAGTPTMTKNGTWAVSNCGQPAVDRATVAGYHLYAAASGAGHVETSPDSADDTVTAEINP